MNTRTTIASQRLNLQMGEDVNFPRPPSTKDTSGWFGPAEVVDVSRTTRGIVSIRHHARVMEVLILCIPRQLHFLVFFSSPANRPTAHDNAWKFIRSEVERLTHGFLLQLGHVLHDDHWALNSKNSKHPGLVSAMKL